MDGWDWNALGVLDDNVETLAHMRRDLLIDGIRFAEQPACLQLTGVEAEQLAVALAQISRPGLAWLSGQLNRAIAEAGGGPVIVPCLAGDLEPLARVVPDALSDAIGQALRHAETADRDRRRLHRTLGVSVYRNRDADYLYTISGELSQLLNVGHDEIDVAVDRRLAGGGVDAVCDSESGCFFAYARDDQALEGTFRVLRELLAEAPQPLTQRRTS